MAKRSKFYQEKRFYLKEHCKKKCLDTKCIFIHTCVYSEVYFERQNFETKDNSKINKKQQNRKSG